MAWVLLVEFSGGPEFRVPSIASGDGLGSGGLMKMKLGRDELVDQRVFEVTFCDCKFQSYAVKRENRQGFLGLANHGTDEMFNDRINQMPSQEESGASTGCMPLRHGRPGR